MVEGGTDWTKKKRGGGFVFEFWEIRCGGTSAASPRRGVARGGFLNVWNVFEPVGCAEFFLSLSLSMLCVGTDRRDSSLIDAEKRTQVGLDAAGKTTILYKLKLGEIVTTIPTIGTFFARRVKAPPSPRRRRRRDA